MPNTSLVEVQYQEDNHPLSIPYRLAGLPRIEFDEAVKPIRAYLEQFNDNGELAKMMLVDNVTNHRAGQVYVRELRIPAGSFILSRVHKKPLVNIISQGRVIVVDTNGTNEYVAPCTFVSPAGTQRIVVAPEETVWNTAHITDVENPDELFNDLTCDNFAEYINYSHRIGQEVTT